MSAFSETFGAAYRAAYTRQGETMSSYLQMMREMERSDALQESAEKLSAKLKAGETVRVEYNRTITPMDVEEHMDDNDLTRDEACEQLAAHYVEQWVRYEWVNS